LLYSLTADSQSKVRMSSLPTVPLVVFAFNRPVHLKRTLDALRACEGAEELTLTLFCDGPRTQEESRLTDAVRRVARAAEGFAAVRVLERDANLGLGASVIRGVTEILREHPHAMVFEDDLIAHPATLRYLRGALRAYSDDRRIGSVSAHMHRLRFPRGYAHDVWLCPRMLSTGWATWADRWEAVDWEIKDLETFRTDAAARAAFDLGGGDLSRSFLRVMDQKQNLWAARFVYAHFRHGWYSLLPRRGYIRNIGYDGSGINSRRNPLRVLPPAFEPASDPLFPEQLRPDPSLIRRFARHQWPHALWERLLLPSSLSSHAN